MWDQVSGCAPHIVRALGLSSNRAPLGVRPPTCKQNALSKAHTVLLSREGKGWGLHKLCLERKAAGIGRGQSREAHLNSTVNYTIGHGRGYHFNHGNL